MYTRIYKGCGHTGSRVKNMGKTVVILPDDVDREFRAAVARKYGGKKGALGFAIKEAAGLWLREQKSEGSGRKVALRE